MSDLKPDLVANSGPETRTGVSLGLSVPGPGSKKTTPPGIAPPLSLIITGFSNLRVAKSRHRRRRSTQSQGSRPALRLKPSSSFKSSVISPPMSRSPGEKRPLLMPGRLKVPDSLRSFSSLSPPVGSPVNGRLDSPAQSAALPPVHSVAFDYRESAPYGLSSGAAHGTQTYRISRSLSSSSLPSLEDDVKGALNTLPMPFGSLSQSVQDFSECCRELECFSLAEQDPDSIPRPMVKVRKRRGGGSCPPLGPSVGGLPSSDEGSTPTSQSCSHGPMSHSSSCASEARQHQDYPDISVNDLAGYLEDSIIFPKKMSYMAEMMYT
ncbi:hypothetical protein TCAL_16632 [Tigriopus californicus]|uniref:Oxidative stress-responsive serine-rich protein 1 n=1 Tax=Tigriopus californicus TaxID=6832 RepID=A0A553NG33_TIGCA|nr:oxidative stress-responsive serine-rich protein 1-like isoform X1 [Tigriopus californicus]XP_059093943.1 oxidative stress-responsive serine-rich protein 1-like isoform X1 [Tigriopus californicus]XP_059093944.1 oxidative stress-responsive serine-rich protein 1-like isoform X1 [Tigriopus californicus]TRY64329.1 hypothetical protein TCAL_16632 [Tigriopus californicus]